MNDSMGAYSLDNARTDYTYKVRSSGLAVRQPTSVGFVAGTTRTEPRAERCAKIETLKEKTV